MERNKVALEPSAHFPWRPRAIDPYHQHLPDGLLLLLLPFGPQCRNLLFSQEIIGSFLCVVCTGF